MWLSTMPANIGNWPIVAYNMSTNGSNSWKPAVMYSLSQFLPEYCIGYMSGVQGQKHSGRQTISAEQYVYPLQFSLLKLLEQLLHSHQQRSWKGVGVWQNLPWRGAVWLFCHSPNSWWYAQWSQFCGVNFVFPQCYHVSGSQEFDYSLG